jgi:hypothetical protein
MRTPVAFHKGRTCVVDESYGADVVIEVEIHFGLKRIILAV